MLVGLERDAQRAVVDELQEGVLRLGVASEQVRRLGEHRFTDKQGRVEFLETFRNPAVVLFRPIENATSGPVAPMATVIAAEAREMLGIRGQVRHTGIDDAARPLGQPGKARITASLARRFEDEAHPFLDQIAELAAPQGRLRLGPTIELVGDLNRGLHEFLRDRTTIKPYLWQAQGI